MVGSRIKVALAAFTTAIVAFGVSGYAGALPGTAQDVAHRLIGAPAAKQHGQHHAAHPGHGKAHAHAHAHAKDTPVGPDATGPAAHGLCNAYRHSHVHGNSMGHSVAMRNLMRAAGGVGKIHGYCAKLPKPTRSDSEAKPSDSEPEPSAPEPEPSETD